MSYPQSATLHRNAFHKLLIESGEAELRATELTTLQVNVGKYCNQACRHCHVDAGPHRAAEQMSQDTAQLVVRVLRENPSIQTLDITGGAPELHRVFRYLVREADALNRKIIDRTNLTVFFVDGQADLVSFLVEHSVQLIASLPCYLEENVDKQRGKGVFCDSIRALKMLNTAGYGQPGSGLELHLVYNPLGASLPPPQASLEAAYKWELLDRYNIVFNRLYTITNMPIARFADDLVRSGRLKDYMTLLEQSFNASTTRSLMCRSMLSISPDGRLFDCDFNQMLNMPLWGDAQVANFDLATLARRQICTGNHCLGCTAGAGSSCNGALNSGGEQ